MIPIMIIPKGRFKARFRSGSSKVVLLFVIFLLPSVLGQSDKDDDGDDCSETPFECPKPNGNFADPCECRRFYICNTYVPTKILCPARLRWDDRKKECTYENEAECGPIEAVERDEEKEKIEEAPKCDPEQCQLPYCFCSKDGDEPPVDPESIPQFILLMIDGAVNTNNFHFYQSLLNNTDQEEEKRLKATFFIQNEYCNYYMVERLYTEGHEIALSSVTGRNLQRANASVWRNEFGSLRDILIKYSNVAPEDILGVRAPRLKPGYNEQYQALIEEGFIWDSSVSTVPLETPVWPYTLDYKIPHECRVKSCPTKSFPGLWELPLNSHFVSDDTGGQCPFVDQCVFNYQSSNSVFEWLKEDFLRNYENNRSPYILSLHTNWFLTESQEEGLHKFVDWARTQDDIFFVTGTEFLLWLTDENLDQGSKTSYQSPPLLTKREMSCNTPNSCELSHTESNGVETLRYMKTCRDCPQIYPWLKPVEEENFDGISDEN
uniref:Chitin deacetylase 4 n=1 Tax=Tigriopus japonicus TaxID=158387 RepID=A0A1U9XQV5_TIGJA|nr:chitin deacetylase 4 [Tigriopus japonicus]